MVGPNSSRVTEVQPSARLWITGVRRARYFSPLALALATMLSAVSVAPLVPGAVPRAEAVDVMGCAPTADRILQKICALGLPPFALLAFESQMIDAVLEAHQLPPEDRPLLLKHARTDVRAAMLVKLLAIVHTPQAQRTADEQTVYQWFQARVWQHEKDMVDEAIAEYDRWRANACRYTLVPEVAQAYNISYSGAPFCFPDPFSLGPEAPDKNYFLAVGLLRSYGKDIAADPRGAAITAGTARGIAFYASLPLIGAAAAAAVIIGTPVLISTGVAAAVFPFAVKAGALAGVAAGAVGSVVLIVLLAVLIGVLAAIKVFSPSARDELVALRTTTVAGPPDLTQFTDGAGFLKLKQTLVGITLPSFPSTDPPPARQTGDPLFVIQPNGGDAAASSETLTYRDWEGASRVATLVGGWFVVTTQTASGPVRTMTLQIDYQDWTGTKWTAWRVGDQFLSAKSGTETTVTKPDFAGATIDLLTGSGSQVRVSVGYPPAITSPTSTAFSLGSPNSFTVVTSGTLPQISLSTGALPAGVTFADRGDGMATIGGTPAAGTAGSYPLTIVATSAAGTATQSFTLNVGLAPVFTSVPDAIFTEGHPGSFTIRASGAPTPTFRASHTLACDLSSGQCGLGPPGLLIAGLTFVDYGDGTATISGTPPIGTGSFIYPPLFIAAANANGETLRTLSLGVNTALAITSANTATLALGVAGTFTVTTTGATPHLSVTGGLPDGVTFTDHGNGTATLGGTPETPGTFVLVVTASNSTGERVTQSFTLTVTPGLTELGPAKAWIGLTNSDSVGLRVDLLAEAFLEVGSTQTLVGRGQLDNQSTGSSGFARAVLKTIPLTLIGDEVSVPPGAELQYRLSVRRTCSGAGHSSGKVALWYNGRAVDSGAARDAGSRLNATIAGEATSFFLHPGLELDDTPGTARTSLVATVTSALRCPDRAFTSFGTWSGPLP